jgi:hypothetical protein
MAFGYTIGISRDSLMRWSREVVGVEGPREVCVAGARATLLHDGSRIGEATSDVFGDFRFDLLPSESGAYRIDIAADWTISFELAKSFGWERSSLSRCTRKAIGRPHVHSRKA